MRKEVNASAVGTLRRKKEINNLIAGLLSELTSGRNLTSLGIAVAEARTRFESLIQNNGGSEATIKPSRKEEMNFLKSTLEQKKQEYTTARELDERLRGELATLQEELATLPEFAELEDLITAKGELAAADSKIATLAAALNEQRALAIDSTGADALAEKRDELLADAALGKDVKKALSDVEAKLSAAEKQSEKGIDAEQAAIVLERRLAVAQGKRAELLEAYKLIFATFLSKQGAEVCAAYSDQAAELGKCVTRLFALDELLDRYAPADYAARFVTGDLRRLKFPVAIGSDLLFSGSDVNRFAAADDEKIKLNKLTGGVFLE